MDEYNNYQEQNEQELKSELRKCAFCEAFKTLKKFDVIIIGAVVLVALILKM